MKRTMQHAEQAERLQHAEIAGEYGDRLAVGKVNAYEEPELAAIFGIASVPAIVVLKKRQGSKHLCGLQTEGTDLKASDAGGNLK